jgi:hypothetical protein
MEIRTISWYGKDGHERTYTIYDVPNGQFENASGFTSVGTTGSNAKTSCGSERETGHAEDT